MCSDVMGTPSYMSPEQAEDALQADTRSDIYSFGASFYHLLTGSAPFTGKSVFSILMKHKTEPIVSPLSLNPSIGLQVSSCLERCLAKSPRDRFQSFDSIYENLCCTSERAIAWDFDQDQQLGELTRQYQSRKRFYVQPIPWTHDEQTSKEDIYRLPNSRLVRIAQGTIAKQQVDVIVSSEDSMIDTGIRGGVAESMRNAGGNAYVNVARRFAPVRLGRAVAVPAAGDLQCKFVFLAVTTGLTGDDQGGFLRPSRDIINSIMESCFYHAECIDVKSIAFPLLGTGNAGLDREVCLDVMFSYLIRALHRGLTNIEEARIIVYAPPKSNAPPQQ
jgi:O-acetyl-ADP-ribose deacetylase (regulator of RNase III)